MISYEFMDNSYGEILRSPLGRPWLSCLLEHVLFHLASPANTQSTLLVPQYQGILHKKRSKQSVAMAPRERTFMLGKEKKEEQRRQ
jgi:hypothetical protein